MMFDTFAFYYSHNFLFDTFHLNHITCNVPISVACYKLLGEKNIEGSIANPMVSSTDECADLCNKVTECTGMAYKYI